MRGNHPGLLAKTLKIYYDQKSRKMRYHVSYTKKRPHERPGVRSETIFFPVIFDKEPSREEVAGQVKKHSGDNFIEESIKFKPDRF